MIEKISLALVLFGLSLNSIASTPDAWEEFRLNVKTSCEMEIKKSVDIDTLKIDPYGTESFGVAIATGKSKETKENVSAVCIFDKVSEKVQVTSEFESTKNNTNNNNSGTNDGAPACNPDTQIEMNACANNDYAAADKKLNDTWKALIAKEKDNKTYIKSLRIAQRAWIKLRDADVDAMFACKEGDMRICWGSMYPMLRQGAMTEITEARTKRLQQFIDKGQNLSSGEGL